MTGKSDDDKEKMWEILEDGPKRWTANVQEDEAGDCYIVFPDELMERVGWVEGDDITWNDMGNGSFLLSKKK